MAAKRYRLARRRKTVGFTQETLAEQLGVDSTTVRRWESGETETGPQPWIRPKLARYLQVSLEQLEELLHESVTDGVSADTPRVDSGRAGVDRAVDDPVDPQQVEQLRQERHDVFTAGATTSAQASNREAALAEAYAEARVRAQELRADTGSSPSQNGNGLVLPTSQEVLGSLVSAVGAELAGGLAGRSCTWRL